MPVFNKMVYNGTEYILGGGGNIGEPLNLTVTTSGLDATITWEDNEIGTIPPTTFQKSELVRKIGSAPTSPSDGDLVVTETVKDTYKLSGYVDQGLTDGETYYYRVFSYSDLGGISYCDAVSVTVSSSWQPGADTIAYYPFDLDYDDYSGNGYNITTTGASSIGTNQGVDCLDINNSMLQVSTIDNMSSYSEYTWLFYAYRVSDWYEIQFTDGGAWGGNGPSFRSSSNELRWGNPTDTYSSFSNSYSPMNTWFLFALVVRNGNGIIYCNNNSTTIKTGVLAPSNNATPLKIGAVNGGGCYGYLSKLILEKRAWTDQEIQDYFNATKGDYGIS